jgi:hypothetical protein
VVGAVIDPWVTDARLAEFLEEDGPGFRERYHHYVSADPTANVDGTPSPRPAAPTTLARHSLASIARAAASANRTTLAAIRRRGPTREAFVLLAVDQGWTNIRQLADVCGCGTRTIRRFRSLVDPALLEPARLCLGDERLHRFEEPRWAGRGRG